MLNKHRKLLTAIFVLLLTLSVSGCVSDPALMSESLALMTELSDRTPQRITQTNEGEAQTTIAPEAEEARSADIAFQRIDADWSAAVTVKNSRVNIRSGPGLEHDPITTAAAGTIFRTDGRLENGWWHICCFPAVDENPEEPTLMAWVSGQVVDANADAESLPLLTSLFPENVEAVWDVEYKCGSERCIERSCTAEVTASERNDLDRFWLILDRKVVWLDGCGQDSVARHQIDRFTGRDVYNIQSEIFLTEYWGGAKPAQSNGTYAYPDGRTVLAWCDEQLQGEVEEAEGWLNSYQGAACYDVRTGVLLSMTYVKRWLFTGEFAGEQYNRAYLGDFELFEVTLRNTNIELAFRP